MPSEKASLRMCLECGPKPEGLPLTDYQRYQFAWGVPGNIEAGEDIRILDLTDRELELPLQDFWLFDDSNAVNLNFRSDGTLVNASQPENPNLEQYLKRRETALAHAIPFNDWNVRT